MQALSAKLAFTNIKAVRKLNCQKVLNLRNIRWATTVASRPDNREHVVILGSGWAGFTLSRRLSPKKFKITVISPRSYFVFTPLLNSTASGTLEFRTAMEPVRNKRLPHIAFEQARAKTIDFNRKLVTVEESLPEKGRSTTGVGDGRLDEAVVREKEIARIEAAKQKGKVWEVPYDKLVIAVGCYSNTFGTKGVKEHAFFMKDIGGARAIRKRVLECFELASIPTTPEIVKKQLMHFAIVGGGPTGIEFAAELHDLIHQDLLKIYPHCKKYVKITVYDIAEKVLSMFDTRLIEYAMETYKREGIAIKTSHRVEELRLGLPKAVKEAHPEYDITEGCYVLKTKEEGEVGCGLCLWSTGNMMNPFVRNLPDEVQSLPDDLELKTISSGKVSDSKWRLKRDKRSGALSVDPHLRVQLVSEESNPQTALIPSVYAMGDNAVIEGTRIPVTAQAANQEAIWLAKRMNKHDFDSTSPFNFKNLGMLAYIGGGKGLFQGEKGQISGRTAWLMWRGAYLTMSVSWRNKMLIPLYWFMTWAFGRDISRF